MLIAYYSYEAFTPFGLRQKGGTPMYESLRPTR